MKQTFSQCSAKALEVGHEVSFADGSNRTIAKLSDYTESPYSLMRPGRLAEFVDGGQHIFPPTQQVWRRWHEDFIPTAATELVDVPDACDEPEDLMPTG